VLFLLLAFVPATFVTPLGTGTALAADNPTEMQARQEFAAGRYDKALELFAKLYAETLHPVYLRNIGRCHQKMREPQKAIDAFKDYLAKAPKTGKEKVTADERAEIEGYIKEMEALRDEQARAAATPPVTPVTPVQPVTPPNPTGAGTPPPLPSATPPADQLTMTPPPAPEGHPIYTRWWFWTGVGVLLAAGITTTALILSSGSDKPACPMGVTCSTN
jgi:hypothetical protein